MTQCFRCASDEVCAAQTSEPLASYHLKALLVVLCTKHSFMALVKRVNAAKKLYLFISVQIHLLYLYHKSSKDCYHADILLKISSAFVGLFYETRTHCQLCMSYKNVNLSSKLVQNNHNLLTFILLHARCEILILAKGRCFTHVGYFWGH